MSVLRRGGLLSLALVAGCHTAAPAPEPAPAPAAGWTLVLLKTGPRTGLPADEQQRVFHGHFANMRRLAEERQLLLAGPYGQPRRDPALRGLFVFATADVDEARALAETDPGFQAGVFAFDYHRLETDADLPRVLDGELALDAAAKQQGRTRPPGDGCRDYVLLTSADAAAMERELAPLRAAGRVPLVGRLDGEQGFAILDATDLAAAEALLAEVRPRLGEHALDPWFGSGELMKLARS
jgi:uncharacterized protein YciI